jgi:hypothetical protein
MIQTCGASRPASSATIPERAFRLSGSYRLPLDINLAGSMLATTATHSSRPTR